MKRKEVVEGEDSQFCTERQTTASAHDPICPWQIPAVQGINVFDTRLGGLTRSCSTEMAGCGLLASCPRRRGCRALAFVALCLSIIREGFERIKQVIERAAL